MPAALWAQKLINPYEPVYTSASVCTIPESDDDEWDDWEDHGGEGFQERGDE